MFISIFKDICQGRLIKPFGSATGRRSMSQNLAQFALFFPIFLFSLSFHEFSHAWTANRLGDPTARLLGRLTLNPLHHIDLIGTVLFPLMMFLMPGLTLFGWAKPVPVNPHHLRGGRVGNLKVSLAGPLSNLLLAGLFAALFRFVLGWQGETTLYLMLIQMLEIGVFLNLSLAIFNLIPIPPLDGSGILVGLLPDQYLEGYYRFSQYGFILLFIAFYIGLLRLLMYPIHWIAGILLP